MIIFGAATGAAGTCPSSGHAGRTQIPDRRPGNSNCRQWVFLIVVIQGTLNWNNFGVVASWNLSGAVKTDSSYELGATAQIKIGGYNTTSKRWLLKGNVLGIDPATGYPTLGYGNLNARIDQFSLTTAGVVFSGGAGGDTGWIYFGPLASYPAGRVAWNCSMALNNGSIKAAVSATCAAWQRQPTLHFVCDKPGPLGSCLLGHFEGSENKPPTGSDWASQVPDGIYADTFKSVFNKDVGSDGGFQFGTVAPFGSGSFSFGLW